ncbi:hypothetical protein QO034_21190 [Sedimentitalea sp. JM2-8]|uniref:DUF4399 domain-containing protein n=1 Tax=Sedimentitalea xiamensis TaxID=3050037 RepID=A0ABT7FK97_9RHOB|nr:hypothetical protein [Sedimentitalea xiamensis]MDK3075586.1 hypothetical protein [Sedimentitalea xiamensis]
MNATSRVWSTACALAVCAALSLPGPAFPQSQSFAATASLPAGSYRGIRLTGVPAGSELRIDVRTTALLTVYLMTEAEALRFPDGSRPVAKVQADGDHRLTIWAPEAGRYMVILDNREGASEEQVAIAVTVSLD